MKISIDYIKSDEEIDFYQINDKECFYSGGVLYMKILQQDLEAYNIINVNAVSILNAGLTFFMADETVNRATKEYRKYTK